MIEKYRIEIDVNTREGARHILDSLRAVIENESNIKVVIYKATE